MGLPLPAPGIGLPVLILQSVIIRIGLPVSEPGLPVPVDIRIVLPVLLLQSVAPICPSRVEEKWSIVLINLFPF